MMPLHDATAAEAYAALQDRLDTIRAGRSNTAPPPRRRFAEYAASLFERKVLRNELRSAKTRLLPAGPMRESDLLFPSDTGGYCASSCLAKPFDEVAKVIKLGKHLPPRAMRRSFQDLARAASVSDVVTRAISGHATETTAQSRATRCGRTWRGW
jgi:hypothetical protein